MSGRRLLQGGVRLGLGQGVAQGCALGRNVILARLISPENFGIAAAFAMTYALLDMMSQLAADVQMVQADDGEREGFQATAQAVQALRGLGIAMALVLLARPVAGLFGAPQAVWAFAALAGLPLLRGVTHLDLYRAQRHLDFAPAVRTEIAANAASLLAALPLALWRRDYSAMLGLLLLQAAVYTAASHWRAQRRYRWAWEKEVVRRIAAFGWPLVINGLLMYGIFQSDRLVIGAAPRMLAGNRYTLAGLGTYSAAFALAMALFVLLSNGAGQLFLPWLARAAAQREEFLRRYGTVCHAATVVAVVAALPLIALGPWVVRAVYGARYAAAGAVLAGLAAMFGLRLMRVPPTLAAMAMGDTKNAMWSNLARSAALLAVLGAAARNAPLAYLPLCGVAGEALALWVSIRRLRRRQGIGSESLVRALPVTVAGALLAAWPMAAGHAMEFSQSLAAAVGSTALTVAALTWLLPQMKYEMSEVAEVLLRRGETPRRTAEQASAAISAAPLSTVGEG
ncbi:MAG: oligosaccharide flippase family protein [Acidobacteriota bacterium]|nr:oligosaccharide flippase family protein [Acidobacteriota bacterium]